MRSFSAAPDFGQFRAGQLSASNHRAVTAQMKSVLAAAGVDWYFLGLDVSLNHVKGNRQNAYWQMHFWGVVEDPSDRDVLKEQIEQRINTSGRVDRPVQISEAPIKPSSIRTVVAYALKSQYHRREEFLKSRPGRRSFWDTQDRPLLALPLVELLAFLDRIGLHGRLLTKGVDIASLQRARAVRASRQRAARGRKTNRSPRKKRGSGPMTA
jgi:hypothetical protein